MVTVNNNESFNAVTSMSSKKLPVAHSTEESNENSVTASNSPQKEPLVQKSKNMQVPSSCLKQQLPSASTSAQSTVKPDLITQNTGTVRRRHVGAFEHAAEKRFKVTKDQSNNCSEKSLFAESMEEATSQAADGLIAMSSARQEQGGTLKNPSMANEKLMQSQVSKSTNMYDDVFGHSHECDLKSTNALDTDESLFSGELSDASSWLSSLPSDEIFSDDDENNNEPVYRRRGPGRPPGSKKVVRHCIVTLQKPVQDFPTLETLVNRRCPFLPRKDYLSAGIYSATGSQPSSTSQSAEKHTLLPPPVNYGEWFMNQESDFMLPYDIHFKYTHHQLHVEIQPPQYTKVRQNIYVDRKRNPADGAPECLCSRPREGGSTVKACVDDCINRCTYYECDPKTCPAGDYCTNREFQQGKFVAETEVFYALGKRTFGLRTNVPVKSGQLVSEYMGEVIDADTAEERMHTVYLGNKCFYFLDYSNGEVLDGTVKGSDARFVNHSCSPNCHIEKWHVQGEVAIGLFASKDIPAGNELTYDYNFQNFGKRQICLCGSDNCRGYIGKSNEFREPPKPKREAVGKVLKKLMSRPPVKRIAESPALKPVQQPGEKMTKEMKKRIELYHLRHVASKFRSLKDRRQNFEIRPQLPWHSKWSSACTFFMARNFDTMQKVKLKKCRRARNAVHRVKERKSLNDVVDMLRSRHNMV